MQEHTITTHPFTSNSSLTKTKPNITMASSSSNINEIKEVSVSYNLATEFKSHVNNEIIKEKGCLKRFVEEHNELQKKVEDRQVPLKETHHLGPLKKKQLLFLVVYLKHRKGNVKGLRC
jgi:hypothetical protein